MPKPLSSKISENKSDKDCYTSRGLAKRRQHSRMLKTLSHEPRGIDTLPWILETFLVTRRHLRLQKSAFLSEGDVEKNGL